MTNITLPFDNNREIPARTVEGVTYVALKPICEGMGVSFTAQAAKIRRKKRRYLTRFPAADGKQHTMLALPLPDLVSWLFSVNPQKVAPEARNRVAAYQSQLLAAVKTSIDKEGIKMQAPNAPETQPTHGVVTLPFDPEVQIPFVEKDGDMFVSVKEIVVGMGLDWKTQQEKIKDSGAKFSWGYMPLTASDGKNYRMIAMPLKKLNGWLFTINPKKVRADVRPKVELYQEKCFEVLYDYWNSEDGTMKTATGEFTQKVVENQPLDRLTQAREGAQLIKSIRIAAEEAAKTCESFQYGALTPEQRHGLMMRLVKEETGADLEALIPPREQKPVRTPAMYDGFDV